jgi:DNA repair exonuclease SbcCD ATPase subunit
MNIIGDSSLAEQQIEKLRQRVDLDLARRSVLEDQIKHCQEEVAQANKMVDAAVMARGFVQKAAEETQQQLEAQMSYLVTSALVGVFPDPYEFRVRFVQRRNKTECDLLLVKDGVEYFPMECAGGGVLDITSFALRVAFWCLVKNAPVIVLDEPFRFLSWDLRERAGMLLQKLSQELGIQFIIVTHLQELLPFGDAVFHIKKGELVDG